jgi:tetratricopeptide (TPR) repeat protein
MSEHTEQGIAALKAGRRGEAYDLLMEAVTLDPRDAVAWLWLADATDEDDGRADCLRCYLDIKPDDAYARASLDQLEVQQCLSAIQCPTCGKVGRLSCPACGGERTELCSTCQGQTIRECSVCHGLGWVNTELPLPLSSLGQSQEEWRECKSCYATGFVDCAGCHAHGRDWCRDCDGSGQVLCPGCAPERLKAILSEEMAEAVLSAIRSDAARSQTLLSNQQASSPLAGFLWRVGFADRPYHAAKRLRTWVETHPLDRAGRGLLTLLPQTPYEAHPPRGKPVQLIKKQPPIVYRVDSASRNLVMPSHPSNTLRDAIMAARIGNRDQAMVLLLQAVEQEPRNEQVWLWLARLVDTDAQRIECLRRVLEINPSNQVAQEELDRLKGDAS